MPKYKIPVSWVMTDEIDVEANSLEEAIQKVEESNELPDGEYLDSSFEVNRELISSCPEIFGEQKKGKTDTQLSESDDGDRKSVV